ncbi:hypothetical protein DFH09DRAFT_1368522 [Mycena vulgaris]|nr:hypothetical protein DFH09DRAFT_1368522 [Mycena vulgaris]
MISHILLPIAATMLCYVIFHVVQVVYRNLTSPLRHVIGPNSLSYLLGNIRQMANDAYLTTSGGTSLVLLSSSGVSSAELHTSDLKAINHISSTSRCIKSLPLMMMVSFCPRAAPFVGTYLAEKYPDQGTTLIPTELKAKALFEQAASI